MDRSYRLTAVALIAWSLGLSGCGDDQGGQPDPAGSEAPAGATADAAAGAGGADAHVDTPPAAADSGPGSDAGSALDGGGAGATAGAGGSSGGGGSVSAPFSDWPVSCRNGLRDGSETDIDCGGASCGTCLSGRRCERGSDCFSAECENGACTCLPLAECPPAACGNVRHCGGELDCGECASGVCYENRCCTPRTCDDGECGVFGDGCGGTLRCGDESCCTPRSCEHPSLENRCGDFDDRCGGSVSCSCADAAATCYLGECCAPHSCDAATRCGVPLSDGCGGVQTCDCGDGEICHLGECCTPLDCSAWSGSGCAALDDGCGGTLSCGCEEGERCHEGTCCTPAACTAGALGDICGTEVDDGCGGVQSCSCEAGLQCFDGECCTAQSCSERGLDQRCGPAPAFCGVANQWCGCGTGPGMRVAQRNACGDACAATLGAVRSCTAAAAREELPQQTAGWDFPQALSSSLCNASYGFTPNWTDCHNGFQLDARGFIQLGAGTHCFSITGRGLNSCGALYFVDTPGSFAGWDALPDATPATLVTGDAPVCFTLSAADYYPIRWHYTQDAGLEDFHVNYCPGSAASCGPIPSAMLYPALQ